VPEAVATAEALVALAERVRRDNAWSIAVFFRLAYIIDRLTQRVRDHLTAEVDTLETA